MDTLEDSGMMTGKMDLGEGFNEDSVTLRSLWSAVFLLARPTMGPPRNSTLWSVSGDLSVASFFERRSGHWRGLSPEDLPRSRTWLSPLAWTIGPGL